MTYEQPDLIPQFLIDAAAAPRPKVRAPRKKRRIPRPKRRLAPVQVRALEKLGYTQHYRSKIKRHEADQLIFGRVTFADWRARKEN